MRCREPRKHRILSNYQTRYNTLKNEWQKKIQYPVPSSTNSLMDGVGREGIEFLNSVLISNMNEIFFEYRYTRSIIIYERCVK